MGLLNWRKSKHDRSLPTFNDKKFDDEDHKELKKKSRFKFVPKTKYSKQDMIYSVFLLTGALGLGYVSIFYAILPLYEYAITPYNLNEFIQNLQNKETTHFNYKTSPLMETEYYNYDFETIDHNIVAKFDQGVPNYLLTQFGGNEIEKPEDQELYEFELSQLYDNSIENYDLSEYRGYPNGKHHRDQVLLAIPLRDAEEVLPLMFKNLMNLTYPHELIDLAFLVSDCSEGDNTLKALKTYSQHLQNGTLSGVLEEIDIVQDYINSKANKNIYLKYMTEEYLKKVKDAFAPPFHENYDKPFRSIQIYEKNFGQVIGQGFSDRHAVKVQGNRRKLMGRARNWLMSNALKPYHSWVYWRDADVELCPGSVIEDLMGKDYDVMIPNVWRPLPGFLDGQQPYDLNSWMESPEALELAKTLDEDDVIVEGYAEYPTWRVHLAYIRDEEGDPNEVVDLDGVGGVSILARAKIFRNGVHFPAFTFENHAETEAFGKMARKMGYRVGGLPHYTIWHIYEPSDDDLKEIANMERWNRRRT
ncbi:mannan polymerase I complex Van1p subunit [Monosporozyma servazzii]